MAEPYHLRLEMLGVPSMNTADNRHWRVRQKEKLRWYVRVRMAAMAARKGWPRLSRARVRITRCTAANRQPDFENLAQGGKFILDGLVKCGVLLDDNPDVIGQPEYRWEKAKRGEAHVIVEVFEEETDG